ncbi:hypothetical protein ACFQE1_13940, partial [Halobium palmae]
MNGDADPDASEPEAVDLGTDAVSLARGDDGIATVTLRNEGMRNAITGEVAEGLIAAFDALDGTETRCVVVE